MQVYEAASKVGVQGYEDHTYGRCCIVFWQGNYVVDLENYDQSVIIFNTLRILYPGMAHMSSGSLNTYYFIHLSCISSGIATVIVLCFSLHERQNLDHRDGLSLQECSMTILSPILVQLCQSWDFVWNSMKFILTAQLECFTLHLFGIGMIVCANKQFTLVMEGRENNTIAQGNIPL